MAFKFNFFENGDDQMQQLESESRKPVQIGIANEPKTMPVGGFTHEQIIKCADVSTLSFLDHFPTKDVIVRMVNGGQLSDKDTVAKFTDVLPGQYEGGLKIWECSFDAIGHLTSVEAPKRMLDLGCGSGLVGIWALLQWPSTHVTFHDLNYSVLESATIPNIWLNGPALADRSEFLYGPWSGSQELLKSNGRYNLISTADTLYDPQALHELHDLLCDLLELDGVAIVAAKRFYFGVGGGVSSFMAIANRLGKARVRVASSVEDGSSNIRDILEFRRIS